MALLLPPEINLSLHMLLPYVQKEPVGGAGPLVRHEPVLCSRGNFVREACDVKPGFPMSCLELQVLNLEKECNYCCFWISF